MLGARCCVLGAVCLALGVIGFSSSASPSAQAKVDFVRDVQPIFKQHCYECHGPEKQSNGFRLDRRKHAMLGGTEPVIGPGSSQSSKLFLRLIGSEFGEKMPKEGTLTPAQIDTIKGWIDQGAVWPDDVSGDVPDVPADPSALRLVEALRAGNRVAFTEALTADPSAVARRGPAGSSPLMFAALYADADAVRRALDAGGNPNAANDAGVTPLMWAVSDLAKSRLLIERGADVNARSLDGRTPLLIASGIRGAREVVALLLARGAKAAVTAAWTGGQMSPITEAARIGDAAMLRMLIAGGANLKDMDPFAPVLAMRSGCVACVEILLKDAPPALLAVSALLDAPPIGTGGFIERFITAGAPVTTPHPFIPGMTLLMAASASDTVSVDIVKALLAKGADVNARGPNGMTALDFARQRGRTPIVDLLLAAGATAPAPAGPATPPALARAATPRDAVALSLPLLQHADVTFLRKAGCVSCHNNSAAAMTVALARRRFIAIDEAVARSQRQKIATYVDDWRERALQGHGIPGEADTVGYILLGLAIERHPPDAGTDAMVRYLLQQQEPSGAWPVFVHRPPIESSDIQVTAAAFRSVQVYARGADSAAASDAMRRGAAWLRRARPASTEDRAFQLLGLTWTSAPGAAITAGATALLAEQRGDGGWAPLPTMESDAYATGQALVALAESGAIKPAAPAYLKGVDFLLKTQRADGSWHVRTRALPLQPPLDAGFPHGRDQFISAAATNWATQALLHTIPKQGS
jgi:ankyrin repeat protein/mono/diheme cytochrome c family protein